MRIKTLEVVISLMVPFAFAAGQHSSDQEQTKSFGSTCPMHDSHSHSADASVAMNERGQMGMGFSQAATTHHFLLKPDGGVIQVEVNDAADTTDRDNIRKHLTHITHAFSEGDFDIPMFVHGTVPPGYPR